MNETVKRLNKLLLEGRTEDVIKAVNEAREQRDFDLVQAATDRTEDWFEEKWPRGLMAELSSIKGMAHYRRKEFAEALKEFDASLFANPDNERAAYGMAYLSAYVDKDPVKTREWMSKLSESPARDNAFIIIARSEEYLNANGFETTIDEVLDVVSRWSKPNPGDPLNVANIMHNAGRFFLDHWENIQKATSSESIDTTIQSVFTLGLFRSAIDLYGAGNINLHHRAAAHYWMGVTQEKLFGPAAAIMPTCQALRLWGQQVQLDPSNTHFTTNFLNTEARLMELITNDVFEDTATNEYLESLEQAAYSAFVETDKGAYTIKNHP